MIDGFNPDTTEWMLLKAWIRGKLAAARKNLEQTGLPVAETEALRGSITAWQQVIDVAEARPVEMPAAPDYTG